MVNSGLTKSTYLQILREQVCNTCQITLDEFMSKSRKNPRPDARRLFCFEAFKNREFKYTFEQIGEFIEKDHATVMHHIRIAEDFLTRDSRYIKLKTQLDKNLQKTEIPPATKVMTKKEINQAIEFVNTKLQMCKDWIVTHTKHPLVSTVGPDIRHWETKLEELRELDGKTYPTMMEIEEADQKQLRIWYRSVPPPRNETELQLRSRMGARIMEFPTITNHKSTK